MSAKLTINQHVTALAANLKLGKVWRAKGVKGSNLHSLLRGFAPTFRSMDAAIQEFIGQSIPTTTTANLAEWENALGLPDDCLPIALTVAGRQRNIDIKLSVLGGIVTAAEFVALAARFDLVVSVASGIEHVSIAQGGYELQLPAIAIGVAEGDFADVAEARMTMVVKETLPESATFDYDFPILFSSAAQIEMRCLFTELKPANVAIRFVTAP